VRGQIGVQFFEKRRRKNGGNTGMGGMGLGGWFAGGIGGLGGGGGGGQARDEEVCWETWRLEVTLATPRTETGMSETPLMTDSMTGFVEETGAWMADDWCDTAERNKALRAMETTLQKTALKIMAIANHNKEHIPPILTEAPFPYQIVLNPRVDGWGKGFGLY